MNDTLDIFDKILKENCEDCIHESIDEHFELLVEHDEPEHFEILVKHDDPEHFDLLVKHDEPCKLDEDPGEYRDNTGSAMVLRKRRNPSSKRIQWWRFFTFEYFY